MELLARAILRTVCFGDIVDAAFSPIEIHRFLGIDQGISASLFEVMECLKNSADLQEKVVEKNGYFMLRGREALATSRAIRLGIAEEKWVHARRAFKRLRHVPFLRYAAVCNTVAMGLPRESSDIDVFLIAAPNRLWFVRFFTHAALFVNNLARHGLDAPDRLCLSFSVSERALDLNHLRKQSSDPYFSIWLLTLFPLFEMPGVSKKFQEANTWAVQDFPDRSVRLPVSSQTATQSVVAKYFEKIFSGSFGNAFEQVLKNAQRKKIMSHKQSRVHLGGTDVVVTDDVLKFHEEDRRDAIAAAFLARTEEYGC